MFDPYTLKARVYPVVILFFPLALLGFFYSLYFESTLQFATSISLVGALTYLFSQLGRDQGKLKEAELWKSWGGSPTTQILRHSDTRIDKYTKQRYHRRLQELCPIPEGLNASYEVEKPNENDEVYKAWTTFLISKTRDTKVFDILFKENISYGFRRNLWALKRISIIGIVVLMIINYLFSAQQMGSLNPISFNSEFWYSSFGLILTLIFWLLVVTRNWVKIPAFAYGLRLCEAIDQLT